MFHSLTQPRERKDYGRERIDKFSLQSGGASRDERQVLGRCGENCGGKGRQQPARSPRGRSGQAGYDRRKQQGERLSRARAGFVQVRKLVRSAKEDFFVSSLNRRTSLSFRTNSGNSSEWRIPARISRLST